MNRAGVTALCVAAVCAGVFTIHETRAGSPEVMTDRCSAEIAFPPTYDGKPTDHGTVVMKRGTDGWSPATTFSQKTGDDGHVRWWCHSTTGNTFDPGTWEVHVDGGAIMGCLVSIGEAYESAGASAPKAVTACKKVISIGSSAFDGWTPERSRCGDHSTKFRARLGPDRLLQTECLGK